MTTYSEDARSFPMQQVPAVPRDSPPHYSKNSLEYHDDETAVHQPFINPNQQRELMEHDVNPRTYLGWSICAILSICGCFPLGIVALMKALVAQRYYDRGDILNGKKTARKARKYVILSFATGMTFIFIMAIVYFNVLVKVAEIILRQRQTQ